MSNRFQLQGITTMTTPKLGWTKWIDPFFPEKNTDDIDDTNDDDEEYWDDDCEDTEPHRGNMRVVVTPMGAIPLVEQSSPNKVFNLWVAHTNFNITPEVAHVVENTEGVETLDIFSRYRMRIGIGKMFNTKDTIRSINTNLLQTLTPASGTNE